MNDREIQEIQYDEIARLKDIIKRLVASIESHEVPVDLMIKAKAAAG